MTAKTLRNRTEEVVRPPDEDVVELSLLVPSWQVEVLAEAAQLEGMTAGQLIRRVLHQALDQYSLSPGRDFPGV